MTVVVVALVLAIGVVATAVVLRDEVGDDETIPAPCRKHAGASASPAPSSPSAGATDDPARGVPVRLEIPSLDIDAPVLPIESTAGDTLTPPSQVTAVGWWAGGAEPGSARGTVVCTAHTVHSGGGVFNDLPDISRGATVRLSTQRGTVTYRVTAIQEIDKDDFPEAAPELFNQDVSARLVMVTCSRYRFGAYRANTVVTAVPSRT